VPIEKSVLATGRGADLQDVLDDLSCVLGRQARLLVVMTVAPGAVAAEALSQLRREELHRALIVAELSEVLALGPDPGLSALVAAVPARWATAIAAHRARLRDAEELPPSLRDFVDS
jgi:hypothetical protein